MSDSRAVAPPLPNNVSDLIAQRETVKMRSLNDDVEDCHLKLWGTENYRKLFRAIWPSEAIEGSLAADDYQAAAMIRDFAVRNNIPIAANAKLHSIKQSLTVVARLYKINRSRRRASVSGVHVTHVDEDTE